MVKVKPSQTCPECGHQEKKLLEQRVHDCVNCGYTEDRDVAAAQVMLNAEVGNSDPKIAGVGVVYLKYKACCK